MRGDLEGNVAAEPRALASGFLRWVQQRGARLWAPLEIMDIQSSKRSTLSLSKDGFTIDSQHIVLFAPAMNCQRLSRTTNTPSPPQG